MEKTREKISTARSLIAGLDYPRTYLEFVKQFPDDDACQHYLKKLRWPEGFICPACNAFDEPWHQSDSMGNIAKISYCNGTKQS